MRRFWHQEGGALAEARGDRQRLAFRFSLPALSCIMGPARVTRGAPMPFDLCRSLIENVSRVVVGKEPTIELLAAALLAATP